MSIGAVRVNAAIPGFVYGQAPRNVYWEMTQACDLACRHCRADARSERDPNELTTEEARSLMADVKSMGSMMILTGGDPMKRDDLFDLMEYGRSLGLPLAITPSTTPTLTREVVARFAELGVSAMGVSLDGPTPEVHDAFRNVEGTFACSMRALEHAREYAVPVQVNTTVTRETLPHLSGLYTVLCEQAPPVRRWSLFVLIPVGRGVELGPPSVADLDQLFEWVYDTAKDAPFHMGTVEAPHYRRFWIDKKRAEGASDEEIARLAPRMGFGVRDGNGVIFVSHRGEVYPAGFLPSPRLGSVRKTPLSEIYRDSPALAELRDADGYHGTCGGCTYRYACGGSRARAFAMTGDVLGSDPLCGLVRHGTSQE